VIKKFRKRQQKCKTKRDRQRKTGLREKMMWKTQQQAAEQKNMRPPLWHGGSFAGPSITTGPANTGSSINLAPPGSLSSMGQANLQAALLPAGSLNNQIPVLGGVPSVGPGNQLPLDLSSIGTGQLPGNHPSIFANDQFMQPSQLPLLGQHI